jgi:hypothetical protein
LARADSAAAYGAVESSMTHISGHDRSQMFLLPEAMDDYVDADNCRRGDQLGGSPAIS